MRAEIFTSKGLKPFPYNTPNQDRYYLGKDYAFILDGHGINGHLVSDNIVLDLPSLLESNEYDLEKSINQFEERNEFKLIDGGSCFLMIRKVGEDQILVDNVGDCRLYCISNDRKSTRIKKITRDHSADDEEEAKRFPFIKLEQGVHRIPCGLNLTRSICDYNAKKEGLISKPERFVLQYDKNCDYVLMTDGVYDYLSEDEIVEIYDLPGSFVENICKKSKEKWIEMSKGKYIDDMTIVLIHF